MRNLAKGDLPGHEFHGNQWTDGGYSQKYIIIHGGHNFDVPDKLSVGTGEGGGSSQILRPLGNGIYGYVAATEEEAKAALPYARIYAEKYGGSDPTLHAFEVEMKPGDVLQLGQMFNENLRMPEDRALSVRYAAANALPVGPERSAAYAALPRTSWAQDQREKNTVPFVTEPLPIGSTEIAVNDTSRLSRAGKWPLSTPDAQILADLKGHSKNWFAPPVTKGDLPGHDFRGNQWTGNGGQQDLASTGGEKPGWHGGDIEHPPDPPKPTGAWYQDATPDQQAVLDTMPRISEFQDLELTTETDDVHEVASSNFEDSEVAPGVREMPVEPVPADDGALTYNDPLYSGAKEQARISALAVAIRASGKIAPLHVGLFANGNWAVLEGQHRLRALASMGYKSIPAKVIVDMDSAVQKGDLPGHEFRGNQWTGGTGSPEFKAWFGDSKVVDEIGHPLVVFHGTTHDIAEFQPKQGQQDADHGAGIYLTDNPEDASANYAGEGPDLTNRIELRAEQIASENEWDFRDQRALDQASTELNGRQANVMPLYARMVNPVVLGGDNPTYMDEKQGLKFVAAVRAGMDASDASQTEARAKLSSMMDVAFDGGATAEKMISMGKEAAQYVEDSSTGRLIGNEVVRQALVKTGYDGIIDHTVSKKWGSESGRTKPMVGVNRDTTHYIVFSSRQVKSAVGNVGSYDLTSPDVTKGDVAGHEFHGNQYTGGGISDSRRTPPDSWTQPSTNAFARGMTEEQVTTEWLTNSKVAQNLNGSYHFYHGSPNMQIDSLRAGSQLATSEREARRFSAHDRGLRQRDMRVYAVDVMPWEIHPGHWATLKDDYRIRYSIGAKVTKRDDVRKEFNPDQSRDDHGRWDSGGNFSSLKTMPSEIDGVPIEKRTLDSNVLAIANGNGILVNTNRKSSAVWKNMVEYQQKAFDAGWQSSPDPNHIVYHELGHVLSKRGGGIDKDSYRTNTNGNSNPYFKTTAAKVSRYAGTNGQEYVAEVYAATRAGRSFDADVMRVYSDLGGPKL